MPSKKLGPNLVLLEKIRAFYAEKLGRDVGVIAAYARDLGIDSRIVSWWKAHDRPVPAVYAERTEEVTGGHVTAVDIVVNEIRDRKERRATRRAKWLKGKS